MTALILFILSTTQLASIVLIIILFVLGFKILETNWSYTISKPHQWEEAVKLNLVSLKLKKMERFYRDKVRFYTFWFQIERLKTENVKGAFAELGVYKGETARMIHEMDNSRRFLLFDTFHGFAEEDLEFEDKEDVAAKGVDFTDTTLEMVKQSIDGNDNLQYIPGYFPASTKKLQDELFALVHLDADLYQPTLEGLRYFYPKLSPGAVLLIHDYNHNWEGVRKAVDEFTKIIDESLVLIPDWQGTAMIIRNRK